jgi:hypothetical protein
VADLRSSGRTSSFRPGENVVAVQNDVVTIRKENFLDEDAMNCRYL